MKKSNSVRTIILAGSLLLQLSTLCFHSRGAAGDVDLSFDPGSGLNGAVNTVGVQPDGKVLVAGYSFMQSTVYRIARLNGDGSLDGTFIPGSFHPDIGVISTENDYNVVTAAAVQSNGKVLIAGYSVHWDCDPESCNVWAIYFLNRVNADGSRDPGFFYPSSVNFESSWDNFAIKSIVVQSDGKVLIGRSPTVNGTNYAEVVRLSSNGSLDGTGVTPGYYSKVESVAVQSDGKLIIGGSFTDVNGTNRNGIARVNANGDLDNGFNPGAGVSGGSVVAIALQSDGKVLIGGSFTNVNGTSGNRIARLSADGSLDTNFNPGTGVNGSVLAITLQPDGKVLIGGSFTAVNGVVRSNIARLYGDSSSSPSLNIARSNASVILSWPVSGLNFQVQENTNLALPNSWSPVAQPAVTNGAQISVTVPASVARKFFRLKSQ